MTLLARIRAWQGDDTQGYDVAIGLLCEAADHLSRRSSMPAKQTTAEDVINYFLSAEPAEAGMLYRFVSAVLTRRADVVGVNNTPAPAPKKRGGRPRRTGLPAKEAVTDGVE